MKKQVKITAAELESHWMSTRGEWGWLPEDAHDETIMLFEREDDPDAWDYETWKVSLNDDYGNWQCVSDNRWTDEELGSVVYVADFVSLRRALGMSQAELATALDRSTSWVRRIEQGQMPCPVYAIYAMRWLLHHASSTVSTY